MPTLRLFKTTPALNPSWAQAERVAPARAVSSAWHALTPVDRVLIGCVLATPLSLVADYRVGLAPFRELVPATPFVENEGREVMFEQLIGWHALVWLIGGALVLLNPRFRRGMVSLPAGLMLAVAVAIPAVTAATARVDSLTLASFFGVGLPLASMVALGLHPAVSAKALRAGVWIVAGSAGALTLATLGKQTLSGSLDRLGIIFFGPTTSTGPVLAGLAVLVLMLLPRSRLGRAAGVVLFVFLLAGVAFSQSRTAALALLIGLSVAAARGRRESRWPFVVGGVFAVGLLTLAPRSLLSAAQSTSFKTEAISHHWRLFLERPSFGYGVSKQSLPAAGGADTVLLGIANGIGAYGAVAFVAAWCAALAGVPWRDLALGGAVLAVYLVGWFGGGEILFQIPITNMLPLALACGLSRRQGRS
jgi:hypothetical protein